MKSLPSLVALVIAAPLALAGVDIRFDDDGADRWNVVLDGVMGGLSSGTVTTTRTATLLFTGDLSLENNGGFSQIRTPVNGRDFLGTEGFDIRIKGDGRTYIFDVRTADARMMAGSFQNTFATLPGEWINVRLPFEDFQLHNFGRRVPGDRTIEPGMIESIGVTLADKTPGPFRLEIERIATFGRSAEAESTSPKFARRSASLFETAINRGAPLYNDGQPEACAAIYEVAIRAVLDLDPGALDAENRLTLQLAIARAERQSAWSERAWTYRRAIDEVHTDLTMSARAGSQRGRTH